jgi:hypothetical protein
VAETGTPKQHRDKTGPYAPAADVPEALGAHVGIDDKSYVESELAAALRSPGVRRAPGVDER